MVSPRQCLIGVLCVAMALCGCAANPSRPREEGAAQRLVTPWLTLTGGMLAPATEPHGIPQLKGTPPVFRPFVSPVSVGMSAGEVYVVDAGASTVFRVDLAMNLMTPLKGIFVDRTTRLRVGPELSLYVLDVAQRRAVRLSRSGQVLTSYIDVNLARPVDVAIEEKGTHVLVADGVYGQIVAFHPLGRAAFVVHLRADERNRVLTINHFALGTDGIYISDASCACVARVARDGTVLETFGHQLISQAGPIAVDRHQRVFVADHFDRSIKVFWHGKLVETVSGAAAGLLQLTDLSVSGTTLGVADAGAARVHLMQIKPPPPGP
jgi:DNA-binding beta-propeller fold protein YncE